MSLAETRPKREGRKLKPKMVSYGREEKPVSIKPGLYYWDSGMDKWLVLIAREGKKTVAYTPDGEKYEVSGDVLSARHLTYNGRGLRPVRDEYRIRRLAYSLNEVLMLNQIPPKKISEKKSRDSGLAKRV